ncbi:hypothetical protein CAAN1_01S11056 [[Candida] anglica]|uniref:4'-phosphopantetheinyl transferase domain-containing protein n=1 Tax=[Candida] anglica TaxID=148631 RepID=A0ABP0EKQ0_9ASCO
MKKGYSTVLGLGIDIVQISRFSSLLSKGDGLQSSYTRRFAQRVLHSKRELPEFEALILKGDIEPCVRYLSGSWAAKEAVFKTLDLEDQKSFQFKDWYRFKQNSKPFIQSDIYSKQKSEEFLHSSSHDGGVLIATVLRQKWST